VDKIQTCSLDTHVTICRNYYYHPTTLQSVHPSEVPLSLFRMTGSPWVLPGEATFPLCPGVNVDKEGHTSSIIDWLDVYINCCCTTVRYLHHRTRE
jgi:hypothetical protein